jgi:hypothetical protein
MWVMCYGCMVMFNYKWHQPHTFQVIRRQRAQCHVMECAFLRLTVYL